MFNYTFSFFYANHSTDECWCIYGHNNSTSAWIYHYSISSMNIDGYHIYPKGRWVGEKSYYVYDEMDQPNTQVGVKDK